MIHMGPMVPMYFSFPPLSTILTKISSNNFNVQRDVTITSYTSKRHKTEEKNAIHVYDHKHSRNTRNSPGLWQRLFLEWIVKCKNKFRMKKLIMLGWLQQLCFSPGKGGRYFFAILSGWEMMSLSRVKYSV